MPDYKADAIQICFIQIVKKSLLFLLVKVRMWTFTWKLK